MPSVLDAQKPFHALQKEIFELKESLEKAKEELRLAMEKYRAQIKLSLQCVG